MSGEMARPHAIAAAHIFVKLASRRKTPNPKIRPDTHRPIKIQRKMALSHNPSPRANAANKMPGRVFR